MPLYDNATILLYDYGIYSGNFHARMLLIIWYVPHHNLFINDLEQIVIIR